MAEDISWRPKTGDIPTDPGVYRFLGASGRVLYVGKAKNLRARLTNYFGPLNRLHERTQRMVTTARSVEWTIVGSEIEALQLEYTWIKEFDPPFNVVFRDDKSYPYLAVTMGETYPRALVTRASRHSGDRYFGPYPKVGAVRETLEFMLKAFPVRSCSRGVFDRAHRTGRPCLLGDIGKCSAPCVGRISAEDHRRIAQDFCAFLSGRDERYVRQLRQEMEQASSVQNYEAAARYRDQLQALETVLKRTAVVLSTDTNADFLSIARDELSASVHMFRVRQGRIRGVRGWVVDADDDASDADLLTQAVQTMYDGADAHVPGRVYVPVPLDDSVTDLLRQAAGRSVRVMVPQRGDKAALLHTVTENAAEKLRLYEAKRTSDYAVRSTAMREVQEALDLPEAPLRIEAYDNSHLGGTDVVGSMVVFEDGLPKKAQYRKFSITGTRDDTESMYQLITRRISRLLAAESDKDGSVSEKDKRSFAYRPSLLLIDGGAPQVSAAERALHDLGVRGITVAGLAKRLEELWLPGQEYPVILPRNSEGLFLLQRIRDEAHRFAITYQRTLRTRKLETRLAQIPGVGPKRAQALLREFGSIARIAQTPVEELAAVPGIGERLADVIHREAVGSEGIG